MVSSMRPSGKNWRKIPKGKMVALCALTSGITTACTRHHIRESFMYIECERGCCRAFGFSLVMKRIGLLLASTALTMLATYDVVAARQCKPVRSLGEELKQSKA